MITCEPDALDRNFAAFICRQEGEAAPLLELVASLASSAVGGGDICLHLAEIAGRDIRIGGTETGLPDLAALSGALEATRVVGRPGEFRPLVLDREGRLYLYRYWKYEQDLARVLLRKAAEEEPVPDETLLASGLARLFPASAAGETDWQRVAALAALRRRLCVISGGPGTGKTSTVIRILALLLEQAAGRHPRIALAAPTGKAAARLADSIRLMKERLDCAAAVREAVPEEVSTLHRLLGALGTTGRFRYSADTPLPFDVVIVDEASMIALPLMARLAVALKPDARLVLLGDRDQLASVEAGAVLGDICRGGGKEPFSPDFARFAARIAGDRIPPDDAPETLPPLTDALVVLKKNYRFGDDSGIRAVSVSINDGKGEEALELLTGGNFSDIGWRGLPLPDELEKALAGPVTTGFGYLGAATPTEALARFDSFRILCALRRGTYGVAEINSLVERILGRAGLIDPTDRWYHGRPVMVTANDPTLRLFNGDVGIVFRPPGNEAPPRVCFPAPDGGVRDISPLRLPEHETVYAMTIHKSQGSEFGRVLLLLPGHDSEIMTRELLYTGITRARNGAEVWGRREVFVSAASRRINRKSGLKSALWERDS